MEKEKREFLTIDCSACSLEELQAFAGPNDENIHKLSQLFAAPFVLRDGQIRVQKRGGLDKQLVYDTVQACFDWLDGQDQLSPHDIEHLLEMAMRDELKDFDPKKQQPVVKTRQGRVIYPKTLGQAQFMDQIRHNDIVFATGPAGTGKTYLAVAWACSLLKDEKIARIILTRPAVEAGESLGFLPGDLKEKVDPYLRPLYDALHEILGQETTEKLLEKEVIEIAPLAFMRGRTLNDAVIILDEAQNATRAQMKMFLTRLGRNARMIITGDITQIDLIKKQDSGLLEASSLLRNIPGIGQIELDAGDVVRSPLVSAIIEAYAAKDSAIEERRKKREKDAE